MQNYHFMTTEERITEQRKLIEVIGRSYEKEGYQPIAGRIMGLLMVMDKERYTFDEITEELNISKSSASNVLRNLEIRGVIEYITIPGDRKRYYQLRKRDSSSMIEEVIQFLHEKMKLLNNIIELKADKSSGNSEHFKEMIAMMEHYLDYVQQKKSELSK